jgi:hypothetical protein
LLEQTEVLYGTYLIVGYGDDQAVCSSDVLQLSLKTILLLYSVWGKGWQALNEIPTVIDT